MYVHFVGLQLLTLLAHHCLLDIFGWRTVSNPGSDLNSDTTMTVAAALRVDYHPNKIRSATGLSIYEWGRGGLTTCTSNSLIVNLQSKLCRNSA